MVIELWLKITQIGRLALKVNSRIMYGSLHKTFAHPCYRTHLYNDSDKVESIHRVHTSAGLTTHYNLSKYIHIGTSASGFFSRNTCFAIFLQPLISVYTLLAVSQY